MTRALKLQQEQCPDFSYFWEVHVDRTLEWISLLKAEVSCKYYFGDYLAETTRWGDTFVSVQSFTHRKITRSYFIANNYEQNQKPSKSVEHLTNLTRVIECY